MKPFIGSTVTTSTKVKPPVAVTPAWPVRRPGAPRAGRALPPTTGCVYTPIRRRYHTPPIKLHHNQVGLQRLSEPLNTTFIASKVFCFGFSWNLVQINVFSVFYFGFSWNLVQISVFSVFYFGFSWNLVQISVSG